jgi:outer membrane receptor protein involved in Fe transport
VSDDIIAQANTQPAQAQEETLDEVVVTGSRIVRRDFEANSPILTVEEELFDNTMSIGIETVLNQLPQFVPAVTQFVTNDVQPSATNTPGASTLSLRALGANRNLVLIDGRRGMPINASGAISTDTIPSAAIARVETITGGASSVYGADAMAGVVNFILKKNFEGTNFEVRYGQTAEGDGQELRATGMLGANFADDEGNVMMGFEYSTRGEVAQADREYYRNWLAEPTADGTAMFWTDSGFVTGSLPGQPRPAGATTATWTNNPSTAAVSAAFNSIVPPSGVNAPSPAPSTPYGTQQFLGSTGTFYWNDDGSLYKTTPVGAPYYQGPTIAPNGITFRKRLVDLNPAGTDQNGQWAGNEPFNLISIPLDRYAVFGHGVLEITDNISAFVQSNFSENETHTVLNYSRSTGGWSSLIPHGNGVYAPSVDANGTTGPDYLTGGRFGLNCPATGGCTNSQAFPTPPLLTALVDSRQVDPDGNTPGGVAPGPAGTGQNLPWQLNHVLTWAGPRSTHNSTTSYQIVTGLEGSFANSDMTWEAYISHGATETQTAFSGFGSLERFRTLVGQPNYGRGASLIGNVLGAGFAGGAAECTSGLPIVTEFTPSADCIRAVVADLQNTSKMEQNVAEFNVQGKLANLPAGEARYALGSSYRENNYFFLTDSLTGLPSYLDSALGLFPGGNSDGETSSSDLYGEIMIPLVDGDRIADEFSVELGYRYTDAEPSGSIETYKGLFDWRVNDTIRVRGGRQVANRAPNIGELFLSPTQTVGGSNVLGDLCALSSNSPLSAAPTIANPAAPLGPRIPNPNPNRTQVLALCQELMGPLGAQTFYDPTSAQPVNGGTGLALINTVGNPDLKNESGETITLGVVIRFAERTSLSLDAYSIAITDLIASQTPDSVSVDCYTVESNPTFSPAYSACQRIFRDPVNGSRQPTSVIYTNEGKFETTGLDVAFNWGTDLGAGSLSLNFLTTLIDSFKTAATTTAEFTEWKGTSGPTGIAGLQNGQYDYRTFTTVNYFNGNWNVSLRWRHLPEIKAAAAATTVAGTVDYPTPSYDIFDMSGGFGFRNGQMTLRYGVDNLLDKEPVPTNSSPFTPGSSVGGLSGFYDLLGRRAYVGLAVSF